MANNPYVVTRLRAPISTLGFASISTGFVTRALRARLSDQDLADHGLEVVRNGDRFIDSDALESLGRPVHTISGEWLVRRSGGGDAARVVPNWYPSLERRAHELRVVAHEEDLPFSELSANAALSFAKCYGRQHRPSMFLIGNGNIRLLWLNEAQEQVGLQFREDKDVQVVLFEQSGDRLDPITAHKRADDVMPFVERNRLTRLF